jgi:hypothetical protein
VKLASPAVPATPRAKILTAAAVAQTLAVVSLTLQVITPLARPLMMTVLTFLILATLIWEEMDQCQMMALLHSVLLPQPKSPALKATGNVPLVVELLPHYPSPHVMSPTSSV